MAHTYSTDKIEDYLKAATVFRNCSAVSLEHLSKQAQIKHVKKGQSLFITGDQANYIYIILSGWVCLYRETVNGDQAIIDILSTDDIFGDHALFENMIHAYSSEAADESILITIPMTLFKQEIETNHSFTLGFLSNVALARKRQDTEIEHRTLQTAPQRIGCFLLKQTPVIENDMTVITLPYEKTLIASKLGMKPETFSRALSKLKSEVGMCVKGPRIEVDNIDDLITYSCESCSATFPYKNNPI